MALSKSNAARRDRGRPPAPRRSRPDRTADQLARSASRRAPAAAPSSSRRPRDASRRARSVGGVATARRDDRSRSSSKWSRGRPEPLSTDDQAAGGAGCAPLATWKERRQALSPQSREARSSRPRSSNRRASRSPAVGDPQDAGDVDAYVDERCARAAGTPRRRQDRDHLEPTGMPVLSSDLRKALEDAVCAAVEPPRGLPRRARGARGVCRSPPDAPRRRPRICARAAGEVQRAARRSIELLVGVRLRAVAPPAVRPLPRRERPADPPRSTGRR